MEQGRDTFRFQPEDAGDPKLHQELETAGLTPDMGIYAERMKEEPLLCCSARQGKELIGIILIRRGLENAKEASLVYVGIQANHRRHGYGTRLYGAAEQMLRTRGFRTVQACVIEDGAVPLPELVMQDRFLLGAGFGLSRAGTYLEYTLKMLQDSVFAKSLEQMDPFISKVQYINQLSIQEKNDFLRQASMQGYTPSFELMDPLFSRFYVDKDKILGFLHFTELLENVLLLSDTYLDPKVDSRLAMPAMLGSTLEIAGSLMPPEAEVLMLVYQDYLRRGVTTFFGKANVEGELREYNKKI